MKRIIVLALFLVVLASGVFALDNNWGFGGGYNYSTTTGNMYGYDWSMDRYGFNAFLFFGISRFIELNVGYVQKVPEGIWVDGYYSSVAGQVEDAGALQAGIYGKIPIPLGTRFVFFPTLGADFEFTLFSDGQSEWWHDLWLRAGVGLDFFITEKFFLRWHALGGYAFSFGGDPDLNAQNGFGLLTKLGIGWMF